MFQTLFFQKYSILSLDDVLNVFIIVNLSPSNLLGIFKPAFLT